MTGLTDRERLDAAEARERERERREQLERLRAAKGIPAKFRPHLDAWRAECPLLPASLTKARRWVRRFVSTSGPWRLLILGGSVGTGKTTAACSFLDAPAMVPFRRPVWAGTGNPVVEWRTELVPREVGGWFVGAQEIASASAYDVEFWDELRTTPRLAIDDLGTERLDAKGAALANIVRVLTERLVDETRTLITTNLTAEAFQRRYTSHDGGRLADRLAEAGYFVSILGPSLRRPLEFEEDTP